MKNGFIARILNVENIGSTQDNQQHPTPKFLRIWWDKWGVLYYELLKLGENITGER